MMHRIFIWQGFLLCALFCLTARAVEFRLPVQPRQLAESAKKEGLPEGVSVEPEMDALKISAPNGIESNQTVTVEHIVNVPPQAAGKVVTFKIKVSASEFRFGSGGGNAAAVTIGGQSVRIPQGNYSWRVLTFKNVKCPADRKLKISVALSHFSGTLRLKEPTAQMEMSSAMRRDLKRKRK